MGRLKRYFENDQGEIVPPPVEETDDDTAPPTPEELAALLQEPMEHVQQVLRLVDGIEAFTPPPVWEPPLETDLPELGLEGFSDTFQRVWDTIVRWLKRVIKWLGQITDETRTALRVIDLRVNHLQAQSRLATSTAGAPLTLQSHIAALSIRYNPPTNIGAIITGLRQLNREVGQYYQYVDRDLRPNARRFTQAVGRLDVDLLGEDALREVTQLLERMSPAQTMTALNLTTIPGTRGRYGGTHLLGSQRLMLTAPAESPSSLREHNQTHLRLAQSELTPRRLPVTATLPRFTQVNTDQCLKAVSQLSSRLKPHYEPGALQAYHTLLNDLTRAGETFTQKVKVAPDTQGQRETAREVIQLCKTVSDWLTNPYHGLSGLSLRAMRGALMVCNQNLQS